MAFGVTATGFSLKRLNDILADLTTALGGVVDPVTGESLTPNLANEDDPLVQVVNAFGDSLAEAWEHLQECYNQFDPQKAGDAGLSGVVQLNGIVRKPGTKSTVTLTLTGTPGLVLPAGKQASLMDDSVVFELPQVVFDGGGVGVAVAEATVDGPLVAEAGAVVKIVTPTRGWSAVTNSAPAVPGTYEETDTQLRARQRAATATPARSIIESIYSGISEVEGVTFCRAYQNTTLTTDGRGIPAKSVAVVVAGGADADIAESLFNRLPAGADSYGSTSVDITDDLGATYPMAFTRPAAVPVYVDIALQVVNPSLWPADGPDRVKAAIVAYATLGVSGVGVSGAYDQDGYLPGQSVYSSDLYVPVLSVPGTRITSLFVGVAPAPSDSLVAIDWNEWAEFSAANISLTVT